MPRNILTLLVVAVPLVLAFGPLVQAQQPAQPPPTWKQGQPSSMADSPLAPIAQPPAPKAPRPVRFRSTRSRFRPASRFPSGRTASTTRA